jgi:hypothetical protein
MSPFYDASHDPSHDDPSHDDGSPKNGSCVEQQTTPPAGALAVRVRVPSRASLAVIERGPWAEPPLVLFRSGDDRDGPFAEVHAATCDLTAAARWVLERGDGAEALGPPPLRHRVAELAHRACRRHRSGVAPSAALVRRPRRLNCN